MHPKAYKGTRPNLNKQIQNICLFLSVCTKRIIYSESFIMKLQATINPLFQIHYDNLRALAIPTKVA